MATIPIPADVTTSSGSLGAIPVVNVEIAGAGLAATADVAATLEVTPGVMSSEDSLRSSAKATPPYQRRRVLTLPPHRISMSGFHRSLARSQRAAAGAACHGAASGPRSASANVT
jgi:hypothetical protein